MTLIGNNYGAVGVGLQSVTDGLVSKEPNNHYSLRALSATTMLSRFVKFPLWSVIQGHLRDLNMLRS